MRCMCKRIIAIILGATAVALSLLWMKNLDSSTHLIPAIAFSLSLVAALGSIKHTLLDLANSIATKSSSEHLKEDESNVF